MGMSAFRPPGRTKGQAHQCSEPTCSSHPVPTETKVVPSQTPTISAALMELVPCLKPNHRTPDSERQWFPPGQFTQLRSIGIETSLVTAQVLWFIWAVRHAAETRWQCVPWFPSPDPGSLRIDLVLNLRSSPYTTAMKMQTGWLTQSLVTVKRSQLSRPIFLNFWGKTYQDFCEIWHCTERNSEIFPETNWIMCKPDAFNPTAYICGSWVPFRFFCALYFPKNESQ